MAVSNLGRVIAYLGRDFFPDLANEGWNNTTTASFIPFNSPSMHVFQPI
jgi:hypothetical protein